MKAYNYEIPVEFKKRVLKFPIKYENTGISKIDDPPIPLNNKELTNLVKRKYGIRFNKNFDENAFISLLSTVIYSKFRPFLYHCKNGSMNDVMDLYHLNNLFSKKLSTLIPPIENHLKNTLVNEIIDFSEKNSDCKVNDIAFMYDHYNLTIYEKCSNHKRRSNYNNWINHTVMELESYEKQGSDFNKCLDKYNGNIPLWYMIDKITFGTFSKFLIILNKSLAREFAVTIYQLNKDLQNNKPRTPSAIFQFTQALVVLRNSVNHSDNILFNNYIQIKRSFFNQKDLEILNAENNTIFRGLFWELLILKYNYVGTPQQNKDDWNSFISEINEYITPTIAKKINFPKNWDKVLKIVIPSDISL
ncbi:Abi family protein [Fructilactobacillus fructivorans]|uniref:Abi family protein n=3 Tax=Fructilactobacillus fructivorans TaxID=1614 RepID=A0AAE6TWX3_9LACO|nr:Abi family protein [Fructilactobacillus fructivorans]KRK56905.1 hypothetical protein FC73_GL001299 [Fructilactobacillus fructivorans]QFX93241.1 hypothetical protein LF543_06690 [Fructilactobacillus fructivorans]RDV65061.1 Abi family protein [Fructilactobacillus fructivorans]